jgi:4-diphosphocytidyl-2-C-methyl-D-erythritol kinase
MLVFPNAKINLGLHILGKREDGYHDIETVFYPIGLCDFLEILPNRGISRHLKDHVFEITGQHPGGRNRDNLVIKAWKELRKTHKLPPSRIHLHKLIPAGSGLGGGSSDAAHVLKAVNTLYELNLSAEELDKKASVLGSDCPFFIRNTPSLGTGRGDELEHCPLSLKGYYLYLVYPGIHVQTGMAYRNSLPKPPGRPLAEVIRQAPETWRSDLVNDFENQVFRMFPDLAMMKEKLYDSGAIYASMSGSGSSVYGLFKEKPEDLRFSENYFIWQKYL